MSIAKASDLIIEVVEQDFERIFREHYQMTYRTAYAVTGRSEDAEDVVQTIFLRLLRRELPPDLKKNPKAYLYKASVNESLNVIKARKRHVLTDQSDVFETPVPDANSSGEEIHRLLYEAITKLNSGAAQILILRYVHGYSDAEIAKLLGTSRGTVAVSLFRTRARLKKLMRASLSERNP
jgi:RNA polymerase sigma-70 factor, ECF subfamily